MTDARRLVSLVLVALCTVVGALVLTGAPALAAGVRGEEGSFGPKGPGSSVFEDPQSIAVEQSSGDVFVYDVGEDEAVYKFNAAGDTAEFSSTSSNVIKGVGGEAGVGDVEIAVDSSGGPDSGDIYVANGSKLLIYSSTGAKLGELATKEEPCGVAVGSSGAVYVAFHEEEAEVIRKYVPVTNPVKAEDYKSSLSGAGGVCDIAVDSAGDVYAAKSTGAGGVSRYDASQFNPFGVAAIGTVVDAKGATLAVDPASGGDGGDVYVDEKSGIAEYSPAGRRVTSFGSLTGSYGVAESHTSGEVYAAEGEASKVVIFGGASEYPLTLTQAGYGSGTVQCAVDGGAAGACAGEYPAGASVKLTATAASGSVFSGFSQACTNSSGPCEVTVDGPVSVTARFALEGVAERVLIVAATGSGTVSASTGEISGCWSEGGVCSGPYDEGETVTLTATPAKYHKVAWSGCTTSSKDTCTVEIGSAAATVTATFTVNTRTLTVVPTGAGSVSAEPGEGISDCSSVGGVCSATYEEGKVVRLVATAPHSTITWGKGCEPSFFTEICEVKISGANITMTVEFTANTHTLTVTPAGSGSGSVSATSGAIKGCAIEGGVPSGGVCSGPYEEGGTVTLEATPHAVGETVAWSSNCMSLVEDTCIVTIPSSNITVTATFSPAGSEYPLKVIKAGTGEGTVTSEPPGIDCGTVCEATFPAGRVELKEEPKVEPGSGSTFAGWSGGGCSGSTASTCMVTLGAATSVTATFTQIPDRTLTVVPSGGAGSVSAESGAISECSSTGGMCSGPYEEGETVILKATTGEKVEWGDCTSSAGDECQVKIGASNITVTATFVAETERTLTVATPGGGAGSVSAESGAISECSRTGGTCSGLYEEGETVILKATPATGEKANWEGCEEAGRIEHFGRWCETRKTVDELYVTIEAVNVTVRVGFQGEAVSTRPESSFGPEGPGASFFPEGPPSAVAVDQTTGDVYVGAEEEEVIYKFNAEGKPEDFSLTSKNVIEGVGPPEEIAVDSSSGPAKGYIYVATCHEVAVYEPSGKRFTTLVTPPTGVQTCGVAVDPSGAVYVTFYPEETIRKYTPVTSSSGEVEYQYTSSLSVSGVKKYLSDIAAGSTYVYAGYPVTEYEASQFSALGGTAIGQPIDYNADDGLAVDPAGGDVYINEGTDIAEYKPSGERVTSFGSLTRSSGVAVSESSGDVYAPVPTAGEGQVIIFGGSGSREVSVEAISELHATSVTLNGAVNPEETKVTACEFEYGTTTAYGQSVPCSKAVPFTGDSAEPVSAEVGELQSDTTYYFRLAVTTSTGKTINSAGGSFTTPGPRIAEEWTSRVSATAAYLHARIDPNGAETSYYFRYGPTSSYGASVPVAGGVDIGTAEQSVVQHVQGLTPGATFHYDVVAVQGTEEFGGPDHTFTTQGAAGESVLPDGREWEMVSPLDKDGAEPESMRATGGTVQASEAGGAITYTASGPIPADGELEGTVSPNVSQILSVRDGVDGWISQDIMPPTSEPSGLSVGQGEDYWLFSSDLALGLVKPFRGGQDLAEPPLSPALSPGEVQEKTFSLRDDAPLAPGESEAGSYDAGKRNGELMRNAGYLALLSAQNAPGVLTSYSTFEDATPDLSHIVFNAEEVGPFSEELYEWGPGGALQPVSVLPEQTSEGTGNLGGGDAEQESTRHAISNDGALVFWTGSQEPTHLYVRDTGTGETLQLDAVQGGLGEGEAEPFFWTANAEGSRVFFTDTQRLTADPKAEAEKPELYVFELTSGGGEPLAGTPTDLTPGGDVQGVLGASEDGSYVYFVADGVLGDGAERGATQGSCGEAASSSATCNLYEFHDGVTTFIATLSSEDRRDWNHNQEDMTSRVSPNGQYLAFMSDRSLTGYDNTDANSDAADEEVFLYDAGAGTGGLVCASCNPTGARPEGEEDNNAAGIHSAGKVDSIGAWNERWLAGIVPAWTTDNTGEAVYQSRYLSDSGRLFFDSPDHLVPAATGEMEKVYEYEPGGVGSCDSEPGCVGLISSGTSEYEAAFLDANASGSEVFFLSADRLVPEDTDSAYDVYDAHECTSASPCPPAAGAAPPACTTAESCRATPAPQPEIFGAPPTATFSGSGNVAPPVSKSAVKAKPLTRAQKLANALKACRKKVRHAKREQCEKQARKKYGAKAKKKAKAKAKKSTRGGGR